VSEAYRHQIKLNLFADTDFEKDQKALEKAARMIADDMTVKFNLGLVIPLDAPRDFRGKG
jgi:hypothetical protein